MIYLHKSHMITQIAIDISFHMVFIELHIISFVEVELHIYMIVDFSYICGRKIQLYMCEV